ncbi:hypothetical protein [Actinospongicola halichondriae]|uniref:hypothetical protein n=1 Tax=Actinospongicola halichondriae TaxID=3236844 RepID=UPI003D3CE7C7
MSSTDGPELSSIHGTLEDLTRRIVQIAERRDLDPDDLVSTGLFEVDRSLRNALRQLERVRSRL